jgi:folate-dependent tRNA-U54 methylase TrmFO/GidA
MDKQETILDFDFGFTAVDADELDVVREARQVAETTSATAESNAAKAQLIYDAVVPLLNNLKANPEKDYIYWPDRYDKLDAFADKLYQILKGD